jgi:hypothetical protein
MKQPLILKQPGIQVRLSDYEGDEFLVYVDIVRRETPDIMQSFLFVKDSLRVLDNEAVLQWLDLPHVPDGRYQRYGEEDSKMGWQEDQLGRCEYSAMMRF